MISCPRRDCLGVWGIVEEKSLSQTQEEVERPNVRRPVSFGNEGGVHGTNCVRTGKSGQCNVGKE